MGDDTRKDQPAVADTKPKAVMLEDVHSVLLG